MTKCHWVRGQGYKGQIWYLSKPLSGLSNTFFGLRYPVHRTSCVIFKMFICYNYYQVIYEFATFVWHFNVLIDFHIYTVYTNYTSYTNWEFVLKCLNINQFFDSSLNTSDVVSLKICLLSHSTIDTTVRAVCTNCCCLGVTWVYRNGFGSTRHLSVNLNSVCVFLKIVINRISHFIATPS